MANRFKVSIDSKFKLSHIQTQSISITRYLAAVLSARTHTRIK